MFRKTVIENQQHRLYGEIALAQPLSLYAVVTIFVISFLALLTFLLTADYSRKETVKGYLIPNSGVIKIYPTQTGTLENLYVQDGDIVEKGDILATVVLTRTQLNGVDLSENVIESLTRQNDFLNKDLVETQALIGKTISSLKQKDVDLTRSISSFDKQIQLMKRRYEIKLKQYERFESLSKKDFLSNTDLQVVEQELLIVQEEIESLISSKLSLVYQLHEVRHNLASKPHEYELQISQIRKGQEDVQRQISEAKSNYTFSVLAKESGVVTAILAKENEHLPSNRPLLSIIPKGAELVAELLFPTRSAGFVEVNDSARLRFDAFPYQRFGFIDSKITRIDKSLLTLGEVDLPVSLNEPVYRVQAKLSKQFINAYGDSFPLKTGMLLEADIILDKRSLFQWLLDPIYSLRGRIG